MLRYSVNSPGFPAYRNKHVAVKDFQILTVFSEEEVKKIQEHINKKKKWLAFTRPQQREKNKNNWFTQGVDRIDTVRITSARGITFSKHIFDLDMYLCQNINLAIISVSLKMAKIGQ